jgi:hypothetical protein
MGRDPLHAWAFARRQRIAIDGGELVLAPPAYVILRKLEFFREGGSEKHLRDIASILDVSADLVPMDELNGLVERRGLQAPWQEALAYARRRSS